MIHGAHVIVYSKDAEADRAFFRDVLKYPFADAGHGWLILPCPGGSRRASVRQERRARALSHVRRRPRVHRGHESENVACSPVHEERWGSLTQVTLPGGGKIGVYQPKHPSPGGGKKG